MAQFTVRDLEEDVKARLKRRALLHKCSMEEEVRQILRNAVRGQNQSAPKLGSRIAARFAGAGLTADLPELRGQLPRPAEFGEVIILDTNVLSALMRRDPEPAVVAWLDRQPAESIWITSITLFETRLGLALLPVGKRRKALETAFQSLLADDLENRVLDFDSSAAAEAASLAAARQKAGHPVDMRDTQIGGIAISRRATLATRNTRHFSDIKVPIIDPWRFKA